MPRFPPRLSLIKSELTQPSISTRFSSPPSPPPSTPSGRNHRDLDGPVVYPVGTLIDISQFRTMLSSPSNYFGQYLLEWPRRQHRKQKMVSRSYLKSYPSLISILILDIFITNQRQTDINRDSYPHVLPPHRGVIVSIILQKLAYKVANLMPYLLRHITSR